MSAKKLWASLALAALSTSLITACSSDSNNSTASVSAADVKTNYVNMAYAVYSDSLSTAIDLQTAVDAFLAAPDQPKLDAARDAYKASRKPYQQSEIMRWDTSITDGKDLTAEGGLESVDAWEGQVNAWPLDESLIESIIAGTDLIDKDLLIANIGSGLDPEKSITTGVHAIEFMLWNRDANAQGPGQRAPGDFKSNIDCAAEATLPTQSKECRNALYLKVASDLLVEDLSAMQAEWSPAAANTQGTLAYNFFNSNAAIDYMVQAIGNMAVDWVVHA